MKLKKFLSILATFTMLLPLAGCGAKEVKGAEREDKLDITPPDLTTEYVESGFLEYYKLNTGIYFDPLPVDAVYISTSCAYRTLREVDETVENIEVDLSYGGGVDEDTPIVSIEVYISGGHIGDRILINSLSKAEYLTEEYEREIQTILHEDENYYEERATYRHTERVSIPISYFSEPTGIIFFFAPGIAENNRWCYGWESNTLYYQKENGKIKFMSEREHAYVTDGSLIY